MSKNLAPTPIDTPLMDSTSSSSLDKAIRASLEQYFVDLGDSTPHAMYEMMLKAMEKPLLEIVLTQAEGNQSRAAEWLGLNRNTLRKKLCDLGLL